MGVPAEEGHATFGPNVSPHVQWSDVPAGTLSLALICHDPDCPSVGHDVNQEGRTVAEDLPRVDFFHWVLVDIPLARTELEEGLDSQGVTPHGKPPSRTSYGIRGLNSYTGWFAANPEMAGEYGGYDGPFPPWNDERLHRYIFTLFALDVASLGLDDVFDGIDAREAIQGHVLDSAEWVGTYTLNPDLGNR
jgi:Raf kinase inhibitor-like YbhB/YbcL family protein